MHKSALLEDAAYFCLEMKGVMISIAACDLRGLLVLL